MTARYSPVAIALHWLIAGLIVANFVIAGMAEDMPKAEAGAFMATHKAIGISVLFFSVFRLFWRVGHKPPPLPETIAGWQAGLGKAEHRLLYFLMISAPP